MVKESGRRPPPCLESGLGRERPGLWGAASAAGRLICFEDTGGHPAAISHDRSPRSPWTPETARREARRLLGEVAAGRDPANVKAARRGAPNFREFADRYLSEHVLVSKKPRSAVEDRRNLERHILPTFGRRLVLEIASADVGKFHASKSATPIAANRCLSLMSHMFNMAERWGLRDRRSNPCEHVAKYPQRARERMLSAEELARTGLGARYGSCRFSPRAQSWTRTVTQKVTRGLACASPRQTSHLHRRAALGGSRPALGSANLQRGVAPSVSPKLVPKTSI